MVAPWFTCLSPDWAVCGRASAWALRCVLAMTLLHPSIQMGTGKTKLTSIPSSGEGGGRDIPRHFLMDHLVYMQTFPTFTFFKLGVQSCPELPRSALEISQSIIQSISPSVCLSVTFKPVYKRSVSSSSMKVMMLMMFMHSHNTDTERQCSPTVVCWV